jgi:cobalt ECF transporter T component CbiQ
MHISIDTLVQDYHESRSIHGLHSLDPRIKLALLVTAVTVNIYFAQLWLSVSLLAAGTLSALYSRIPLRLFFLFFLLPAWSTLVVVAGFTIGFGTTPMAHLGPVTFYKEGLSLGISAAARVACDMSWMAAVFLTTPFNGLLKALKWFKTPEILLDTIAMGYRYVSLIFAEFTRMKNSAMTRGGFHKYRYALVSTARIVAQVILRAYDRASQIQEAMTCRGAAAVAEDNTREQNPEQCYGSCPNRCDITPEYRSPERPVLVCRNLSHQYGALTTLDDINLRIHKNEIVVLCGPNGAGKTTLLKLFCGIYTPSGGEIYLEGCLLNKETRNTVFHHTGFLCQDPNNQLFCTHVKEDVAFGPSNLDLPPETIDQLVNTAMELTEVSDIADKPIHRLSCGQMKRVGLAGLIAMKPPLLLLDEPSASLDPAATRKVIHHLRHLNAHHGYTFVIVTHDMNLAARIAQRIIILDKGKITADGTAREILTNEALLEASRLEPPLLTRMFQRLLDDPIDREKIPLTLEEALAYFKTNPFMNQKAVEKETGFSRKNNVTNDKDAL